MELGVGRALVVGAVAALVLVACSRSEDRARLQARWDEERRQQERAAAQAAADEQGRKNEEQRRAYAAAHDPEVKRARLAKLWSEAAGMSTSQREAALRERCGGEGCDVDERDAIIATADNDAERRKLLSIAKKLEAAQEAEARRARAARDKAEASDRELFAESIDGALLQLRSNPDGVSADGPEKRTLHVRGWFCTRQFVHDFQHSETARRAKAVGFRRLVCESALETWSGDI